MWNDNAVQFARLLAEINCVGLEEEQLALIADSMNLDVAKVQELFDRADKEWEKVRLKFARNKE